TNRLVEYSHGYVEVLPMPTEAHQIITMYFHRMLLVFVELHGLGLVLFAPLRIRLWEEKFRAPDVVFMRRENAARRHNEFWDGADLVMEVVSDGNRAHDLEKKRFEYARAGIPEYWIIDPLQTQVSVLKLAGDHYAVHGVFSPGQIADSPTLPGFSI